MTSVDSRGTGADSALEESARLVAAGSWLQAIDLLTEANRAAPSADLEVQLVKVRHSAFAAASRPEADPDWPPDVPDCFPASSGIPEVSASDLSAEHLASALRHRGSLLVRGLLEPQVAASLLDITHRAFEASAAAERGATPAETAPYYLPFEPDDGYPFGYFEQYAARAGGGVLLAESPRSLFHVIEAYKAIGLGEVLAEYLGEWPALSVKKSTLRRAVGTGATGWHQDGNFLGTHVHTVNVWTALTPCGVNAPSVDVFARAFEDLVPSGTEGAKFDWSVSQQEAEKCGAELIVRPTFEPGDALLFNHMTLHKGAMSAEMPDERYAIESWFFGPSAYPLDQVPLVY